MAAREDTAGTAHERKREQKILAAAEDKRPLVERLYSLYHEMKAQGWQDPLYAPRDGTEIEVVEMGSLGIFKAVWCSYDHKHKEQQHIGDCGCFFAEDGGDSYPSHPVMWRPIKAKSS